MCGKSYAALLLASAPLARGGTFAYGIYNEGCTIAKAGMSPNPKPNFDTESCNSWSSPRIVNSMVVTSCSSTCVCYTQTPGTSDCTVGIAQAVKESCTDRCHGPDAQGTYLHISNFSGGCSPALTVPDHLYACAHGMASTPVAPSAGSCGGAAPCDSPSPGLSTGAAVGVGVGALVLAGGAALVLRARAAAGRKSPRPPTAA